MRECLKVLIVEDSVNDTFFIVRELQRGGFQVRFERVETPAAMQSALATQVWDLVISDYCMPQFSGLAALALFRQSARSIPFIVVSGAIGEDRAIEMLKSGADDCVMKDNLRRLVPAVRRELAAALERRLLNQVETATAYLASIVQSCDEAIVGHTLDGTVQSWNAAAERLYGYSGVEMLGNSIKKLYPEVKHGKLSALLARVGEGERIKGLKMLSLRKDGRALEVELIVSPIRGPAGQIIGASTIARESTERAGSRQRHSTTAFSNANA
jgi:PAS domain S-box-containing protein